MTKARRKFPRRFKLSTLLVLMVLAALFFRFVLAPEYRRTEAFNHVQEKFVFNSSPVVLFGSSNAPYLYLPDLTEKEVPEPGWWFSTRQWIAGKLGIKTTSWHKTVSVSMYESLDEVLTKNLKNVKVTDQDIWIACSIGELQDILLPYSNLNDRTIEYVLAARNLKRIRILLPVDLTGLKISDFEFPQLSHLNVRYVGIRRETNGRHTSADSPFFIDVPYAIDFDEIENLLSHANETDRSDD